MSLENYSNFRYFRNALVRANYRNYQRNIDPAPEYLEAFFRNLLLGENNELKNRYLVIDAPDEFQKSLHPTSTPQVPHKLIPDNISIQKIIAAINTEQCSVISLMKKLALSDRKNFLSNYLNPAIGNGFVRMLYPESPRHPRQKYLLTEKGLAAYRETEKS